MTKKTHPYGVLLLLLVFAETARAFLPVPGINLLYPMSGTFQHDMYIARRPFSSANSKSNVLEVCRNVVLASNWQLHEAADDALAPQDQVVGRSGEFLWIAAVESESAEGCRGYVQIAFPQQPDAVLPDVGRIYPYGEITLRTQTEYPGLERQTLLLKLAEPPSMVLPYVTGRLRTHGWTENRELRELTTTFGSQKNSGYLFYKGPNSLMIVAAMDENDTYWQYFFKMRRLTKQER